MPGELSAYVYSRENENDVQIAKVLTEEARRVASKSPSCRRCCGASSEFRRRRLVHARLVIEPTTAR